MQNDAKTQKQNYDVESFLAAFSISRSTFYNEVKSGRIKTTRIGSRTFVTRSDADEWLKNAQEESQKK